MSARRSATLLALAIGLFAGVADADAQSLTSLRGPGYPLLPTDARGMALGGLSIGLKGAGVSLLNPAEPAGILRRGVVVALEGTSRDVSLGDASGEADATRFPLIHVIYPVRRVVVSVGYAGFLDQAWGVTRVGQETFGPNTVEVRDAIESTGGLGQFQLGLAVPLGEDFALGAAVGAYTGGQRIRLERFFDSEELSGFQTFDETFGWRYAGRFASFGARADLGTVARVGASVTWSGTVRGDSVDGRAVDRDLELPLQAAAGASVYLSRALLAAVSARWSGWGATERDLPTGESVPAFHEQDLRGRRDTWEFGFGLELDDPARRAARSYPIRVGYQYRQLPFTFVDDAPSEWFVGGGVGLRIGADAQNPLGLLDLSVQRGTRSAAGSGPIGALEEQVWRVSLSLSLFGT